MASKATVKAETFESLCKELGKYCSEAERGLLCYRAYQAYVKEHPTTAQGRASKRAASLDRDPSFREEAAKLSGVKPSTIDALLQVGKAMATLPKRATTAANSLPLRCLRKLATREYDKRRAGIIEKFGGQV